MGFFLKDKQGIKSVGFHSYFVFMGIKFHEFRGNHSFKDTTARKFMANDNK